MLKDFDAWSKLKKKLEDKKNGPDVHTRDVWWCHIGCNIGEEANGKNEAFSRPILVLKRITKNSFVGLPLTSKDKEGSWYVPISIHDRTSNVVISQVKMISTKRLTKKIARVDKADYFLVKKRFRKFFS